MTNRSIEANDKSFKVHGSRTPQRYRLRARQAMIQPVSGSRMVAYLNQEATTRVVPRAPNCVSACFAKYTPDHSRCSQARLGKVNMASDPQVDTAALQADPPENSDRGDDADQVWTAFLLFCGCDILVDTVPSMGREIGSRWWLQRILDISHGRLISKPTDWRHRP